MNKVAILCTVERKKAFCGTLYLRTFSLLRRYFNFMSTKNVFGNNRHSKQNATKYLYMCLPYSLLLNLKLYRTKHILDYRDIVKSKLMFIIVNEFNGISKIFFTAIIIEVIVKQEVNVIKIPDYTHLYKIIRLYLI